MFKTGWLNRGRIKSDEGYEVIIVDRSHLEYRIGGRKAIIRGELLTDGFALEVSSLTAWDNGILMDETTKTQILDRVKRALASQGMEVDLT